MTVDPADALGPVGPAELDPATSPEPIPPTQVKHPWRTVVRTFLQNLPIVGVVIVAITQTAQEQQVGWVEAWGPGAIAAGLFLTRVMAIPAVNDLLTAVNLGAAPKA